MKLTSLLTLGLLAPLAALADNEIGFIEKFALADDRAAVLSQLIPGSEDFYYFRSLHEQNVGNAAGLASIMDQWAKRYPTSDRRRTIENRAALLKYETAPKAALDYLRDRLALQFTHEVIARDRKPDLPESLDQNRISRDAFRANVLLYDDLSGITDEALDSLVREKVRLNQPQVRALLSRIRRPDVPGLLEVVEAELRTKESRGFGEFPIHKQLLPEQLDELARRIPTLADSAPFVLTRLHKLMPGADADVTTDPAEREAWLERAWNYAVKLPPAFNTLRSQILFQRLQHDRLRGVYDRARFIEYLKLPRRTEYANPRYVEQPDRLRYAVDLNANFSADLPILPPSGNDEWLVRDYLLHLLRDDDSWEPWAAWLRDTYVKPIFAEAKITAGIGDATQWSSFLSPPALQALRDRVDVDFAATNPPQLAPADEVHLELLTKNTPKLIVKLYELNALSYFLTQKQQLNTDINLDGLVANQESTRDFSAEAAARDPFRRIARTFDFPELKGRRGAWIVEFIGGGKSSRALIRKGQWHLIQQTGPAGDMITVVDETSQPVKDAVAWVDGRRLAADAKIGAIVVPFTKQPGTKPVVLANAAGTFATLAQFEAHAETYDLAANFHLEREQLLTRREATLAIRAALRLGDEPVALSLLQDAKLTLTLTSLDGVVTTKEIPALKFDAAGVFTVPFPVPNRTAQVVARLTAQVESLSGGGVKQSLERTHELSLNGIVRTPELFDLHLSKMDGAYVLEVLGRNGETVPDRRVTVKLDHRDFATTIDVELGTDSRGRILLGALPEIERVTAILVETSRERHWLLAERGVGRTDSLHGRAGEDFRIPWTGEAAKLRTEDVSLLERRSESFVKNYFSALSLAEGFLVVKGLPPGDYSLFLREESRAITVRVTAGEPVRNWLLAPNRHLEVRDPAPVQIESATADPASILIRVRNANSRTRVHVSVTRFLAGGAIPLAELGAFGNAEPAFAQPARRPNLFAAGRAIGDEYRYILERRAAKAFPGNALARPGLLLNPWEVRSTDVSAQGTEGAEALNRSAGDRDAARKKESTEFKQVAAFGGVGDEVAPALDFLATPAITLYNLTPDADGVVKIDRKALGDRQYLQVFAEDGATAAWRALSLPEVPTKFQDIRLARSLDPARAFAEKKTVTVLKKGDVLTLADLVTAELETYDTLASAHALLATLNADANFAKFDFILRWPQLKPEEKRAKYSEFACHELNFFLSRKDPAFFAAVIQPYLRNKKDRTFMDDYLVGADLQRYREPWAHARLNAVERCLLAQRIAEEKAATARQLRELWELLPPKLDEQDHFFETALRGRALGADGSNAVILNERSALEKNGFAGATRGGLGLDGASTFSNSGAVGGRLRTFSAPVPAAAPQAALEPMDSTAVNLPAAEKPKSAARRDGGKDKAEFGLLGFDAEETKRLREVVRAYFRELGPTKEWAENNYYQLPVAQQNAERVTVNAFWRDYAAWDGTAPFLSEHLAEASRNFTEMMLALAVLDLPFEAGKHESKTAGATYTFTAAGNVIAYHKQIKPAEVAPPDQAGPGPELLVSENFFRVDDRYREEGNERSDKYVTAEFLSGVLYGANVVVTNPRSTAQKLELLLEIPQGAIPANGSKATDSRRMRLEAFTTQTFEYFFYFPAPGEKPFLHYPVHVSRNEQAAGSAQALSFKVVKQLSTEDKTTWDYISQSGTDAEVFEFLDKHNLSRLDFEKVAWRARKSPAFLRRIVAFLGAHHVWSEPVWRYGILHNDAPAIREWLRHRDDFVAQCGPWFDSPLLKIDPVERQAWQQLEYSPLVNQRAHRIGAENKIPNEIVRGQYQSLLAILAHKATRDAADEMSVVYFLFLQDRVEEALARFHTIKPEALPTRLQYDYFRCYAAFYEEQPAVARTVAAAYADYPVDRWRQLFAEAVAQLDEAEGKKPARPANGLPDPGAQQSDLAATEPAFDFKVENRTIAMTWKNLGEVTINYYLMDPEFLFSASPFVTEDAGRFSIIKPTQTATQALAADKNALDIPLPATFSKSNVLVEILGAGIRKAQPYHANTLKLTLAENYGRLDLRDTVADKPLPKAYVKVYARLKNGAVRFFKDGYTDLRGKFDYASLNSSEHPAPPRPLPASRSGASGLDYQMLAPSELNEVDRLSILVLSEEHGATVREVAPPSR